MLIVTKTEKTFDFSESTMNRKKFGMKIGTVLTVLISLGCAVLFWLVVKYTQSGATQALSMINF